MLTTRRMFGNLTREDAQHLADEIQRPVGVYTYDNPGKLILRVRPRYRFLEDIKRRNAAAGQHYFEPRTMRFFQSRVQSGIYIAKDGRAYFVTSERGPNMRRAYSVRVANHDGSIDTVGEFQGYATGRAAHAAARREASNV